MKKKKEEPNPDEIKMSLDEYDEVTHKQFYSGKFHGMYKCNDITLDTIARLKQSLEDVWAVEYTGVITDQKKAQAEKLTFAINTLVTLEDMFLGEYDSKLSAMKLEENIYSAGSMSGDEFLNYLDDIEVDDE